MSSFRIHLNKTIPELKALLLSKPHHSPVCGCECRSVPSQASGSDPHHLAAAAEGFIHSENTIASEHKPGSDYVCHLWETISRYKHHFWKTGY